ncbi:hypothetical protein HMPREF1544_05403 [Mucor circinelloides 1006PhL]|uniref:Uncharacterized protein n=1 Tax=Mucor circinelloides f. circinelloides (strain 1006PhL) TaxID=1220926 RepID=S2JY71_MUCC1|nr:hypothetical protein HMPREF1544_05403 [Mucor circinelloides 1006PhL]
MEDFAEFLALDITVQLHILVLDGTNNSFLKAEQVTLDGGPVNWDTRYGGTDNGIVTFTETSKFDLPRSQSHLELYNRYQCLESKGDNASEFSASDSKDAGTQNPDSKDAHSKDRGSGNQKRRSKKDSDFGKQIASFEAMKSDYSFLSATAAEEHQRCRLIDRLRVEERQDLGRQPVLFVGDRGYAKVHGRCCPVLVTNEHNTSQICLFCFKKASHPLKLVTKNKQYVRNVNGSSVCTNPTSTLRTKGETHKARDSLPALAVGLAGLSTVIFGQPILSFDPSFSES